MTRTTTNELSSLIDSLIPIAHDLRGSLDSATSAASAPPADSRTAVPRTSSSDTDIIARSDYLRGSLDPATSTASAPPADSRSAVPRTSSSDTDIIANDLRGSLDSATPHRRHPPRPWIPGPRFRAPHPRIRILLPTICVVLRIPPRHIDGIRPARGFPDRRSAHLILGYGYYCPRFVWFFGFCHIDVIQNTCNFAATSLNIIKPASVVDSIARLLVILPLLC